MWMGSIVTSYCRSKNDLTTRTHISNDLNHRPPFVIARATCVAEGFVGVFHNLHHITHDASLLRLQVSLAGEVICDIDAIGYRIPMVTPTPVTPVFWCRQGPPIGLFNMR